MHVSLQLCKHWVLPFLFVLASLMEKGMVVLHFLLFELLKLSVSCMCASSSSCLAKEGNLQGTLILPFTSSCGDDST